MTFDDSCHLYWSSDGGEVFRMNRNTGNPVLLHDFNQITRAMTFHPGLNLLFMAAASTIYSMPTSGGTPTALPTGLSTYMNGMEVAPSGWGTHGGKLIVGHNSGAIYAVDPITGQSTVIGSTTQEVSDIVFDGMTLYAAVYDSQTVYTVSPTGTFTTFATPGCSPDGLAVKSGQTLYIACGSNDTLHKATIPGGTVTSMGSATLNGGWAPAGLIFDGLDTLIVMEDTATLFHYVD
ncbi:MAG: hypothetical protein KC731_38720 [Myxococcales bacterium]|nr:hypothetical protein [Myxococcales bacterium]